MGVCYSGGDSFHGSALNIIMKIPLWENFTEKMSRGGG